LELSVDNEDWSRCYAVHGGVRALVSNRSSSEGFLRPIRPHTCTVSPGASSRVLQFLRAPAQRNRPITTSARAWSSSPGRKLKYPRMPNGLRENSGTHPAKSARGREGSPSSIGVPTRRRGNRVAQESRRSVHQVGDDDLTERGPRVRDEEGE
jgi:hypothetical protein